MHQPIGNLYVWNDDEIAPGAGFPFHAHADVEIITYVREGTISHRDSLGNSALTCAGDVQVMSAGAGIRHIEANAHEVPAKLFQIWIHPRVKGGSPSWGTKPFPKADRAGRFVVLASGFSEDAEALPIRADARLSGATLPRGSKINYPIVPGRKAYLVSARGRVTANGVELQPRDGAAFSEEQNIEIAAHEDAELVVVETTETPSLPS